MLLMTNQLFARVSGSAMDLRQFMVRQQVLRLYREILRTIYKVEDLNYRKELLLWARHDFQKQRHLADEQAIKMMITMGQRHLKELQAAVYLAR